MFNPGALSETTSQWQKEAGMDTKALRRFVRKRIHIPRYTKIRKDKPWVPSPGTRIVTGDDVAKISKAVLAAYGEVLGEEYSSLQRLEDHIRANELARAFGYEPTFFCIREKSADELIFMSAEIRQYKRPDKGYFDIDYFWIYEWVSTIKDDSTELISMLKDLRRYYGHVCSRAKHPLNVRGRANGNTSYRIRSRFQKNFERELASRGMESKFKMVTRKRTGDNFHIALNNSLNKKQDEQRRAEFATIKADMA